MASDQPNSVDRDRGSQETLPVADRRAEDRLVTLGKAGGAAERPGKLVCRQFGDYELLEEIARGAMGVVYRARQRSLNRIVAVKMILGGEFASPVDQQRFLAEAEAAASLDHPGIVPVFQVGEHDGQRFYSMAFVAGPTLSNRLAEGPVEPREAAGMVRAIAEAVHYAHTQGVIHRDLKPGNVLLDGEGRPRVTDFGLAKRVLTESHLTTTGQILGTPSYMSPEQACGQTEAVGIASDVYSLGAILYAMLAGRPPFQAATVAETLHQVLQQEPVPLRQLNAGVPADLETIALKCLEKSPERRYRSAEEVADELARHLDGRPIHARPVGRLERLRRWGRRNPVTAMVVALSTAAVLFLAIGSTAAAVYLQELLHESEANRQLKDIAERDAQFKLWESYLSEAAALRLTRRAGHRAAALRAIAAASRLPTPPNRSIDELRNEAVAAMLLPDLAPVHEWEGFPAGMKAIGFDRSLERYARQHVDTGHVSVRRVDDDAELFSLPGFGSANEYYRPKFSPDGRFLEQWCLTKDGWRGRLWRVDGPKLAVAYGEAHCALDFSPDGKRAAAGSPDGSIRILELEPLRELRRLDCRIPWGPIHVGPLKWNPRRPQLLTVTDSQIAVFDAESGAKTADIPIPPNGPSCCVWHPEGRAVALSGRDGRVYLWDVDERRLLSVPLETGDAGGLIGQFNPTGDQLLTTDWGSMRRLWDLRTGRQLLSHQVAGTCIEFSADETRVAADAGISTQVRLFAYEPGREFRTLVHRTRPTRGPVEPQQLFRGLLPPYPLETGFNRTTSAVIDPTGRLLAVGVQDGVALFDLDRCEEAFTLAIPGNNPLLFDRQGSLWTHGAAGIARWPLQKDGGGDSLRYGPPETMLSMHTIDWLGASANGEVIAVPRHRLGVLLLDTKGKRETNLATGGDIRYCAVSPDGRWLATGNHGISTSQIAGARIWDAGSGKHVRDLPVQTFCCVWFSPDGRWLATLVPGKECRLWKTATWEPGPQITHGGFDPRIAFTADGSLLALQSGPGSIRLVATETGQDVGRLQTPEEQPLAPLCFTSDGGRLVVVGHEGRAMHVFDLRLILAGLRELGLGWVLPQRIATLPPRNGHRPPPLPAPLRIDVMARAAERP